MRRSPLYYIGKAIASGLTKTCNFIDTHTAPGRWWHNRFDQFMFGAVALVVALVLLLHLIQVFIAAPLVTGTIVGVLTLVVASLYTYSKHKE